MKKTHLLTIDPQVGFSLPTGNLYVPGADEDMQRLAKFIDAKGSRLAAINVTLDSHQWMHIAHPLFWKSRQGNNPSPFTIITKAEVEAGEWICSEPRYHARALKYVQSLETNGRYILMIWPPHCIVGTPDNNLHPAVGDALKTWEEGWRRVTFVAKGNNPFTEHYSALKADVPDDTDPTTKLNTGLLNILSQADELLITGEALSHCVSNSITDCAVNFGDDAVKKFTLLADTCSNVPNCETMGEAFVKKMTVLGMRVTTTKDWS